MSLFIIMLMIPSGCSKQPLNKELVRIYEFSENNPKEALIALDAIDYKSLKDPERHYFDFVSIKAQDKADITFTSDSLILDVIEYAEAHKSEGWYTEALYYGGRVFSELGDYPSALHYFQNSLDLMPDKPSNRNLRGKLLIQTWATLNSLRLYEQAIPYVIEAIKIDSIQKDTIYLMDDTQLLGSLYLHLKDYESAEKMFEKAVSLAKDVSPEDENRYVLYLAAVKYVQKDYKPAIELVRRALTVRNRLYRNTILAYAAEIYHDASVLDTAKIYAMELIKNPYESNKVIGYKILLANDMIDLLPKDSLADYFNNYKTAVEKRLNQNGDDEALIQNSYYNYNSHLKKRIEAESKSKKLYIIIVIVSLVIFVLLLVLLISKYRNKAQLLRLHESLDKIKELQRQLDDNSNSKACEGDNTVILKDEKSLREELLQEISSFSKIDNKIEITQEKIYTSDIYLQLKEMAENDKNISDKSDLWGKVEDMIMEASPRFRKRISLLLGGDLSSDDYRLSLLMKCGFSLTHMSALMAKSKSTLSYRRDKLGIIAFGQMIPVSDLTNIIKRL